MGFEPMAADLGGQCSDRAELLPLSLGADTRS